MADADDVVECPLCMEELDETDKRLIPCKCNYRVCLWCYHHIKDNLNGKCPACRAPYDEENLTFIPLDPEDLAKKREDEAREKDKLRKVAGVDGGGSVGSKTGLIRRSPSDPAAPGAGSKAERQDSGSLSLLAREDIPQSRRHLANVRVMQRNLVYIIGLSLGVAKEDTLRSKVFFGRFGKIAKVVINKNSLYNSNSVAGPTVSAYITYHRR